MATGARSSTFTLPSCQPEDNLKVELLTPVWAQLTTDD